MEPLSYVINTDYGTVTQYTSDKLKPFIEHSNTKQNMVVNLVQY